MDNANIYSGICKVVLNNEEMANFYSDIKPNHLNDWDLLPNQYLIILDADLNLVDQYRWDGVKYQDVLFKTFDSRQFGKITPKNKDIYQICAFDSLSHNQLTVLRGPAGTGKTLLAFGFMFQQLEKGIIDKIIIFANPVATKGSAKLGYYPGSRTEKLLDSQIGNMLCSKVGSSIGVEQLIAEEKIVLLPFSDIRGYDTSGMRAAVYISEAQNLDIDMMKLALQRIGDDSICIVDGDDSTQVDMSAYEGCKNGMRRMIEVFKGKDFFGVVTLKNIYRSKIAKVAQEM